MCSIEQRVAEIGRAIDELAIKAGMPAEGAVPAESGRSAECTTADGKASADGKAPADATGEAAAIEPDDPSRIVVRLAELWGLLADLDPEVARRLAGYQALLSPADPPRAA